MAHKKGTKYLKVPMSAEELEEFQRRAKDRFQTPPNYARQILLDGKINKKTK